MILFAGVLVTSALLKLRDPFPAAQTLGWSGLGNGSRIAAVDLLSLGELLCGSLLLLAGRMHFALWMGFALGVVLMVAHGATLFVDPLANCGCFGRVEIPGAVVLSALAIGVASTIVRLREAAPRRASKPGIAISVTCVVIAGALAFPRPGASDVDPVAALESALGANQIAREDVVLVGSSSCADCLTALAQMAAARSASTGIRRLHFVERATEADEELIPARDWIQRQRVPDRLWWSLVTAAPPVFLRRIGGSLRVTKDWRRDQDAVVTKD